MVSRLVYLCIRALPFLSAQLNLEIMTLNLEIYPDFTND